ncbi:ZINC FINGER PROTEIN [Salix purpurea]|uniref:ZINC FINGER PROTEIN n=1 Tax=Salix purpurea TaxID=77065 RepID=A0A9Q0W3K1_SALPP|nr:ZINC FINGER PROTEIN [Salix purpurea]
MQASTKEEDGDTTSEIAYTDMNQLKNACLSFARDRYDIFRSLSIPDIQTVVESGCPNLLRKAVNSAKRMRAYVQKDEGDACGTCTHRGVCDRAYVILKGNDAEGRTVDIVRVLMFHALDPSVISGGQRSPGSELIETSSRKLLSELIELSETPQDPALPKHTPKASHMKERDVDFMDGQLCENVEMKKEDWMCTKCNFMNFSKNKRCQKCGEQSAKKDGDNNIEVKKGDWICSECEFMNFSRNIKCLKCKAVGPKRPGVDDVEMKKGDWNCNSCGFMNFASNKTCLRCRDPRPEIKTGEWNCPSCDFLNFSKNKVCLKCNCVSPKRMAGEWNCPSCDFLNFSRNKDCFKCKCKRPKEATTEYEERIWKHPY